MMDFKKYQAVQQLLTEGKVDDLKKLLIDSIKDMDDASELEKIAVTLREPIIRGHLEEWAKSKNLPAAMVDYLTNILIKTNKLSVEQKLQFAADMEDGNYYMDFGKMLKASESKRVSPSQFYKRDTAVADYIMMATKDEKSNSIVAAPTNVGKGEIAFIILGGLEKPKKGDLEFGSAMIEVKEGSGAAIAPKGMVHPTKFLKDMQGELKKALAKDVFDKLPKQLGKAGDSLAKVLSITEAGFPFGQFCKENKVPIKVCKDIMQSFHNKVYSFKFDVKKYIKNDYTIDTKRYGKDSFEAMFKQYQKEYGYTHLMYFFSGAATTAPFVYSMKTSADAGKLFDKAGVTNFSGADEFGRAYGFGGTYNVSKMKKNL